MGGRIKGSLVAGALLLLFAVPSTASAATITPTTTADELNGGGACSLREAISSANGDTAIGGCPAGSGQDTIALQPGAVYVRSLTGIEDANNTGDLDILAPLTIVGPRPDGAVIEGNGTEAGDRVLDIYEAATISGVTIRNGNADSGGGGILVRGAPGNLTLSDSTVSGNVTAPSFGGAIENFGVATITNTTLSGNRANFGGGLDQFGESATLKDVTVTNNTADGPSASSGGLNTDLGTLTISNTIVAGNTDTETAVHSPDCNGSTPITSQGHNLIGDTSNCTFVPAAGDLTNVNPLLGPLQDNGGPTFTHGLTLSSPAVDKGSSSLAADQRGFLRPVDFPEVANSAAGGNAADIGAFELQRVTCKGQLATHIAAAGIPTIGTPERDVIVGTDGADVIRSRAGRDLICAEGGKDKVNGGTKGDRIFGQGGRDRLKGKNGPDKLIGGKKKDVLRGGKGPDRLKGGKGRDVCKGGKGDDSASACEVEKSI